MPNQRPEAVSAAIDYMGEIARRKVRGNHAEEHWDVLLPYIRKLEADNARKTAALEFYAAESTYNGFVEVAGGMSMLKIDADDGKVARAALAKEGE